MGRSITKKILQWFTNLHNKENKGVSIKSPLGRQLGTQFDSVFDVVKSNPMYDKSGGKIPSLDLNFAKRKSLKNSRSTENEITFSRASSGTFVGADGLIKTTPVTC